MLQTTTFPRLPCAHAGVSGALYKASGSFPHPSESDVPCGSTPFCPRPDSLGTQPALHANEAPTAAQLSSAFVGPNQRGVLPDADAEAWME